MVSQRRQTHDIRDGKVKEELLDAVGIGKEKHGQLDWKFKFVRVRPGCGTTNGDGEWGRLGSSHLSDKS